jgi:hypothetical protein
MAIYGKLSTSLRRSLIASSRLLFHTSLVTSLIEIGIATVGATALDLCAARRVDQLFSCSVCVSRWRVCSGFVIEFLEMKGNVEDGWVREWLETCHPLVTVSQSFEKW